MWIFQNNPKKVKLDNETELLNEYTNKITDGKLLTNQEIENILLMNINNLRRVLEYYNKTVYSFNEFIIMYHK